MIYLATETISCHYRKIGRKSVFHPTQELTTTFCSSSCRSIYLGNDFRNAKHLITKDYEFDETCTNCGHSISCSNFPLPKDIPIKSFRRPF
jgi:hypothetical protein